MIALFASAVTHGRPASNPVEVTVGHDLFRGFPQSLLPNIRTQPHITPLPFPAKSFIQWGTLE